MKLKIALVALGHSSKVFVISSRTSRASCAGPLP
eukprot:CAMPEP_0172073060 /NCGR_PEP_ID=MMETSP1043-20130122/14644_1 /TAXON_ID=464988 /ORGANISM="Hemiselmis andersenii, Strain CCMP441" /LENGTH=33 /DNA_ID= /DNA_START= /DNA_END= /DNA_ORIENTATION=